MIVFVPFKFSVGFSFVKILTQVEFTRISEQVFLLEPLSVLLLFFAS